jgi:gas vesicle protein
MKNFREHALIKRFISNGFTEAQAENITDGVIEIIISYNQELATKADISELKSDVKTDISELKSDVKTDISELKSDVKTDISELKASIVELKTNLKWIIYIAIGLAPLVIKMALFPNLSFS